MMHLFLRTLSLTLILFMIRPIGISMAGSASSDDACGAPGLSSPNHPSSAAIRDDRFMVKLTAEAAAQASSLPEYGLPRGLPELDLLVDTYAIEGGFRIAREHGTPIGDPALFRKIGLDRLYAFELSHPDRRLVLHLVREFKRKTWIEYAEPVYEAYLRAVPNDPLYPDEYEHNNTGQTGGSPDADMDSPEAWDLGTGNSTGIVAVLDTGVNLLHEDLVDNLIPGWDFVNDDDQPEDDHGHGTGVAGSAAARGNNGKGVAGVCWTCSLMPLKVIAADGSGTWDDIIDAIRWAADNGADTINMSFGGFVWLDSVIDAVDYAAGRGTLSFAAAGNRDGREGGPLQSYPNVVSVGGSDHDDLRIYAYGEHSELTAPSLGTTTTGMDGGYHSLGSGTSSACPHAAGLGAMLRAQDPDLHVRELRHLMRLGADDLVGRPSEDTPGWDQYMGFGRINSHGSMALIDGPWLALDRPHYVCAGDLTVALKDKSAEGSVAVTITGDLGGDSETITANPITNFGYFEGTIPISWADRDGPVVAGDGKLDLRDGETITASTAALSATAFVECVKKVCRSGLFRPVISGDCDGDGAADPGEIWSLAVPLYNDQTELMLGAVPVLTTTNSDVEILDDRATYSEVYPMLREGVLPDDAGGGNLFRFRVRAGAAADSEATFNLAISGRGWDADETACIGDGHPPTFSFPINRDPGPQAIEWNFDDGTSQGFTHEVAHDSGSVSECIKLTGWYDDWGSTPSSDRSQSGAFAMRLGDGTTYRPFQDAGLITPAFDVPPVSGSVGFYVWASNEIDSDTRLAWDGMIVEAKRTSDTVWSFLADATYNTDQRRASCPDPFTDEDVFPFGTFEAIDMLSGDGDGTAIEGDSFDREQRVDLTAFAGDAIQLRFRFGSNSSIQGRGVWIDTISVYEEYTADTWPADAPSNLQGSDANCPASFDLSWDPVAGAEGYNIYRSDLSCADAQRRPDLYGTSTLPEFSDIDATKNVDYYYAVEAKESGRGCPTERSCVPGSCACALPADPTNLLIEKDGNDLLLTWDDPSLADLTWNIYRDETPDPSSWGPAHAQDVVDEDQARAGIQYRDAGAVSGGAPFFYLVTANDACGESPLR